jgi:putative glutamine amidotransferase
MSKPLIGVTAYDYVKPENGWHYDISYCKNAAAIERAGGLPVLIPSSLQQETLRAIYERLDAVLLPGGGDVNPSQYKSQPNAPLVSVSDARDAMELSMASWALADDLPILGICRGIQLLNVAMGGSLVQDIPSAIESDLRHDIQGDEPRNTFLHEVQLEANSRLASILGDTQFRVNSLHHQALRDLAPNVKVVAKAPDGIVEAIEVPDKHFVMAVQWHPEDLLDDDSRMENLFKAFVQAAQERMKI